MLTKSTMHYSYSTTLSPKNEPVNRLAALLAPMTLEEFHQKFWPDELCVVHGPLDRLPPPFNGAELSDINILFSRYAGRVLFGKGTKGPRSIPVQQVNPAHLYAMGLSLYLPDLEPAVPGASGFLREVEKALGIAEGDTQITAWASPGEEGIAAHFDPAEVISIQLRGTKRFYVSKEKAVTYPIGPQFGPHIPALPVHYMQSPEGFSHPDDFEFTEIEMKPGSVLFMPRGVWHYTQADQDSLSVSINIAPKSTADALLRELNALLLQDANWRRPIYGESPEETLSRIQGLLDSLPKMIETIRPQDLLPPQAVRHPEQIQPDTRFQRFHDATIRWEENRGMLNVKIGSGTDENTVLQMHVSKSYEPVLQWLKDTKRAFSVQEIMDAFADISLSEHQKMLFDLARLQFLQRLWFRPIKTVS